MGAHEGSILSFSFNYQPQSLIDAWHIPLCNVASFIFLGGLQPCAAYFSGGVVNSGCSDEAVLSLTGKEKTREETGVRGAKAETPSIYRQRQIQGKKRGENRTDKGTRGEKKGEVQKQQELIKQPVLFSLVTPVQTADVKLRFDVCSNKRQHSHV